VAKPGRIKDENLTKGTSVASSLKKQLAFDVVDNDGMWPGQELTDCKEAFPAAGWRNNQEIAKLAPCLRWPDAKRLGEVAHSEKQACLVEAITQKVSKLVNTSKLRIVQLITLRKRRNESTKEHRKTQQEPLQPHCASSYPTDSPRRESLAPHELHRWTSRRESTWSSPQEKQVLKVMSGLACGPHLWPCPTPETR
jgi:hypothetical protein